MLALRPSCEHCNKALAPDAPDAMICTFECTFCQVCVEQLLENVCPNCAGGFTPRPIRPRHNYVNHNCLDTYPASTEVVHKPVDLKKHKLLLSMLKGLAPELR
ncbi:DUF1272 domain-containing protein [Paraglaciecola agarilytica]|uniref:DUF1272 domain-containing protein n=1 Tax=Paraglaciecola chathamensis TaxID=368405 RepID=A0ABS0WCB4_9ALTE|nr:MULTISPECIES: DUF1272 domain-containing protein [Paraglaciecola]MBJ2136078.1 DUF1272 domain-containing protein [Paraglaciecola chathamensis]MBU3019973.1 DUF1272 domain-containing protein [Paraglaciecola agarilytica]MDO6557796.1 DUF1272 domain-containing protein [Paraglaciecola chathamensis]